MKGDRGSRGRRRVVATLAIAALGALALVAMPLSSGAVNFASFQLEGDTAGADDWDALYPNSSIFTQDGSGATDDQLVQGTADKLDFDSWTWKAQAVTPPKSDIQWAYATPAVVNNELVVYFGSDRANDDKAGSVNVGFWLLQGDVGPQSGGSFGPDKHVSGDLFVAAEIDSGGRVANIAVYKWDPSAQKNLALQTTGSYGECSGGTLGSLVACGIANNSSSINAAWRGSIASPYFFEGGINVSKLFDGAPPCFSSFLSNTRSSFSVDAAGQDIVGGQLDTCGRIEISKTTSPSQSPSFGFATTGAAPVTGFELAGGQSKEFTDVKPGAYTVSEMTLPQDWALDSLSCPTVSGSGTSAQVQGGQVSITLGFFGNVECTYVNKRKPQVKLVKDFEGTGTPVDLKLGDTVKGTFSADGDTGFFTVDPGSYTASEVFQQPNGGLYTSTSKCVKNGSDPGLADGLAKDFTVAAGDEVVCTFRNQRKPEVKVTKQLSPTTDPGKFDLQVNGETKKEDAGNGETTGFVIVGAGQVSVGELAGTGTSLGDYDAQITCGAKGDAGSGATSYSFAVGYGDQVECTVTNTRKTGTIEVVKVYRTPEGQQEPSPYSSVALKVDGTTKATAPAQLTTGAVQVNTGLHAAAESFVQASDADLYTSSGVCRLGDQVLGTVSGDGRGVSAIPVGKGDAVVCTFTNTRKARSIDVTKAVSETVNGTFDTSASKPEPGGTFYFKVTVENTSAADTVTITGLEDLVDGIGEVAVDDLVCDIGDGTFPFQLDPGESVVCTFTRDVTGDPRTETDHVDASWKDEEGQPQDNQLSNDATVTITNLAPAIGVDKVVTGASSLQAPGGSFSYRVTITNQSLVEDVTITSLADFVDTDGALNGSGTPGAAITMNGLDCTVPFVIAKGGSKVCTFTATVNGPAGTYFDVVVVNGADNEGGTTTADDDASVTLTSTPPPPPPPPASTPVIDIQVIKDATAQVQLGQDGKAAITYTALIRNNGPNMANDVQLADPAPSGVVFGQITKQPDFGSCQITPALLTCNLGTMGYGVQTLISWTATVSATGTIVNTATTTGSGGPDRVTTNNVDDARTLVVAPVTPPAPKPKPKQKPKPTAKPPVICSTLTVAQRLLKANGHAQVIRATVKAAKKPIAAAKVNVAGVGVKLAVRTNRQGVARATVKPKKAGIIKVWLQGTKACNTQRIGVVGVFEPPVTG